CRTLRNGSWQSSRTCKYMNNVGSSYPARRRRARGWAPKAPFYLRWQKSRDRSADVRRDALVFGLFSPPFRFIFLPGNFDLAAAAASVTGIFWEPAAGSRIVVTEAPRRRATACQQWILPDEDNSI